MASRIKIIVFDAYGTLLDLNHIDGRLILHFGEKGKVIAETRRNKQLEYSWLRTLMNHYKSFKEITLDALNYATEKFQYSLTTEIKEDILNQYRKMAIFAEVPGVLKSLKDDFKIGVLSNANSEMLSQALSYNQVYTLFDKVISADQAKKFKPHPEVYQLATKIFTVKKEEILFVSSNPWDIVGAKKFGFDVCWINRKEVPLEELDAEPNQIIHNLNTLLETLKVWSL